MRIENIKAIACLILASCVASYSARAANNTDDSPAKTAEYVKAAARQLAAEDPIDVEAAIIRLATLPPDAFASIEATAADPSLDPKAAGKLKTFIELQRPWQAARLRIAKAGQDQAQWNQITALEAYEKAGTKDARWDALARQAITRFCEEKTPTPDLAEKAIEAGCNDPFILYIQARLQEAAGVRDLAAVDRVYQAASDAMIKSEYPAYRQIECCIHAFQHHMELVSAQAKPGEDIPLKDWAALQALASRAEDAFADLFDDNPPPATVLALADQLLDTVPEGLHKEVYDAVYHAWQKASPDNAHLLTFTGQFYVNYAWEVRGSGLANTVTELQWTQFRERLYTAAEALTAAWDKDHTNAAAATTMLSVELGQGKGKDRMELWYRRALEADPDNEKAVAGKMNYLNPKWHGSQQQMLAFAHELFQTHNWRAGFPMNLANVYGELIASQVDPQAFLAAPQVWQDIQSVYVPYLKAFPEPAVRSTYCYRACRCAHWDTAKEQFKLLGKQAVAERFGGEEAMKELHAQADQKGTVSQKKIDPATP